MLHAISHCRRVLLLIAVAVPCAAQVPANVRDTGTTSLVLLYRCRPEDRPAFRGYLQRNMLPRLRRMEQAGTLAQETVLFSRYVDTDNWNALIFLQFPSSQAAAAWASVEASTPAGLDGEGLRLVSAVSTYPLDLMQTGSASVPAQHPVFLVIPYDYTVSPDEYIAYLRDYVQPQTAGWIEEGALESYRMFIGRDASGRPWSSVLLLEYKDEESFGRRAAVINDVRAKLRGNPDWKAISDRKQSVRVERASILADEIR